MVDAKNRTNEIHPKFKSPIIFGPLREREGRLFVSSRHHSGRRLCVVSVSFQSRAHALKQEGSLVNWNEKLLKVLHFLYLVIKFYTDFFFTKSKTIIIALKKHISFQNHPEIPSKSHLALLVLYKTPRGQPRSWMWLDINTSWCPGLLGGLWR